jgi:S-adenosylmethionine uptake transporter
MKLLATQLPVLQIVGLRFVGYFALMVPLAFWRAGRRAAAPARPGLQALRGLLLAGSTFTFVTGAKGMDYADAIAVLYVYPFMITLLSPFVLGERVPFAAWAGVGGGFAGVMLVMRPDVGAIDSSALYVLACAVFVSLQMVLNRQLGRVSDPMVTSMWGALVAMVALTPMMLAEWQPLSGTQIGLLILVSAISAISQTFMVLAFARAPAAELAPFTYVEIVAGVVYGLAFFGTLPDTLAWVGMALIVLSGILVARARTGRLVLRRQPKI